MRSSAISTSTNRSSRRDLVTLIERGYSRRSPENPVLVDLVTGVSQRRDNESEIFRDSSVN